METKTFIEELARRLGSNADDVATMIDAFATVVKDKGMAQESVAIPGFGTFSARKEMEHIALAEDGKRYLYPPKIILDFEASAALKNKIQKREGGVE